MRQTKLIEILSSLDPKEMKRFERFVQSPYFNTHEDTTRFFELLKPYYPEFPDSKLNQEEFFKAIYPKEKYNDNKIRTLRKYLLKLVMQFMGQQQIEEDEWLFKSQQISSFVSRGLWKHIPKMLEEAETHLKSYPNRGYEYYVTKLRLEEITQESRVKFGYRNIDTTTPLRSLDYLFIIEKLKISCAVLNTRSIFGKSTDELPLLNEVLKYCEENLDQLPLVAVLYYHAFFLQLGKETNFHFQRLAELMDTNPNYPSREDMYNLLIMRINTCMQWYRAGDIDAPKKMFVAYKQMLDKELLVLPSGFPTHHYKNITTLGLRLGEFEWTERFINDYKVQINDEYREGVYNYNLAHLYSYQGHYRKALKHLQQSTFIDPFYRISYNMLLLKIYYECDEIESLLALCTSFRTFLRRKEELADPKREPYLNFIRFTRGLFMVKIRNKGDAVKIREEIGEATALTEKSWLLEKACELIKDSSKTSA